LRDRLNRLERKIKGYGKLVIVFSFTNIPTDFGYLQIGVSPKTGFIENNFSLIYNKITFDFFKGGLQCLIMMF